MRKVLILLIGLWMSVFAVSGIITENNSKLVFVVNVNHVTVADRLRVLLDLNTVINRVGKFDRTKLMIFDLNNGRSISYNYIDSNNDGNP
ncbi:MAG TPA: hypothetical protein VIH57_05000, partial [Bacteroidales bacterium]